MSYWVFTLMTGVATIWVAMLSAVAYRVSNAGERTRTSKGARPNGT